MQTAPGDAFLEHISKEQIIALANLYDRFAHALDPFSPESDQAESVFKYEVAALYDFLGIKSVSLHDSD
jgi:hypothetical protein